MKLIGSVAELFSISGFLERLRGTNPESSSQLDAESSEQLLALDKATSLPVHGESPLISDVLESVLFLTGLKAVRVSSELSPVPTVEVDLLERSKMPSVT